MQHNVKHGSGSVRQSSHGRGNSAPLRIHGGECASPQPVRGRRNGNQPGSHVSGLMSGAFFSPLTAFSSNKRNDNAGSFD